ncbi:YbaK/prolyl-tRNA synthetase associated domain-containing protein [Streptomyces sp. BG9H]|uniref:YbaK/prolyl-tRNA synthetase associated domain-containing protein n=1 Tax=Streptomyces anatolicus TaxID=2675858 RepID=A0ABS6YG60_9ACTN|nr:YbaK/EbsC family protein [Streptomyces anatolicus]MBW5420383.1 YbaK/prolyl-tRNA synthetase associated domain-containing protein [Streptomyces anatolicus]
MTTTKDSHAQLIEYLERSDVRYRLIEHPPEGRTDRASAIRGHRLEQAAKCLVVRVGYADRRRRYLLTVVPGHCRIGFHRLKHLYGGTDVALAAPDVAERLTGCVRGSITPFNFNPDLELLADPRLLEHPEIYFNAACLDRSLVVATRDYVHLARPRLVSLVAL